MTVLADATKGQRGKIVQIDGTDEVAIRLLEMGLTPGVEFEFIGVAPLGDPIEIELRGYRLSLRKTEATRITVDLFN